MPAFHIHGTHLAPQPSRRIAGRVALVVTMYNTASPGLEVNDLFLPSRSTAKVCRTLRGGSLDVRGIVLAGLDDVRGDAVLRPTGVRLFRHLRELDWSMWRDFRAIAGEETIGGIVGRFP